MEKPTPTAAEQELMVPGLKLGHYLCFFGMHVLTPGVMDLLEEGDRESAGGGGGAGAVVAGDQSDGGQGAVFGGGVAGAAV